MSTRPPSPPPSPPIQRAAAQLSLGEFVSLMALLTSLVALAIDSMLPALPAIARDLGVVDANDAQLVVSVLFVGLAAGQMIYGPLSDSLGRKPAIYLGIAVFIFGCLLSILATTYWVLLLGRCLQGFGAAAPRIVVLALIRDQYDGSSMARILSLVTSVFIIVPALAPALGQAVLLLAGWRAIFGNLLALASVGFVWFWVRQPETLPVSARVPLSARQIGFGIRETLASRPAIGYMLGAGLVFGAFVGYLSSAQQIFQDQYGVGTQFPIYFGALALALGAASYANARLVMRYGMRSLSRWALTLLATGSTGFLVIALLAGGQPSLSAFMTYMLCSFFCVGIVFGNFNSLALEPLGHVAGIASAVIGSVQTFVSVSLGFGIGRMYDGTVVPLVGGFALLGTLALATMRWTESRPA